MRSIGRSPTERRQRGSQPDERRIRQGIAQVAGEAVGHLAGLFIHLAAEAILAAVHFIRCQDVVTVREHHPDRGRLLPRQRLLALVEGGFYNRRVERAEAGEDFHCAPSMGQGLGGLRLPHEGVGEEVVCSSE